MKKVIDNQKSSKRTFRGRIWCTGFCRKKEERRTEGQGGDLERSKQTRKKCKSREKTNEHQHDTFKRGKQDPSGRQPKGEGENL